MLIGSSKVHQLIERNHRHRHHHDNKTLLIASSFAACHDRRWKRTNSRYFRVRRQRQVILLNARLQSLSALSILFSIRANGAKIHAESFS